MLSDLRYFVCKEKLKVKKSGTGGNVEEDEERDGRCREEEEEEDACGDGDMDDPTTKEVVVGARSLSADQHRALGLFEHKENIFLSGEAGTGKTELIKAFVRHCLGNTTPFQVCALTGCATLLLGVSGARTVHSFSGLNLRVRNQSNEEVVQNALRNRKCVAKWKKLRVLIVDEVSMMSKRLFELLEELARRARRSGEPFGGLQVVFSGDFFQLPPVCTETYECDDSMFCFQSPMWSAIFPLRNHVLLKTMFRQQDPVYCNILSQIRKGSLDEEGQAVLQGHVDRKVGSEVVPPPQLFSVRYKVDRINQAKFAEIEASAVEFALDKRLNCSHYLDRDDNVKIEAKHHVVAQTMTLKEKTVIFQKLVATTLSLTQSPTLEEDAVLRLKVGALVMSTTNLDMERGVCNGSQGVVVELSRNGPVVLFDNGVRKLIKLSYVHSDEFPTIAVGYTPLCLSWAITIHKMQGATLAAAKMDLGTSIFEYGQIYVALSRIKSLDGLYLSAFEAAKIRANPTVTEFYRRVEEEEEGDGADGADREGGGAV